MKNSNASVTTLIISSLLALLITSFITKKKESITGVWKVCEVQTVKANGAYTSVFPIESQAMFFGTHYSFCWQGNTTNTRNWQLSDSTKLLRFNQSIINAGTFTYKNNILTTKASFAMNPMFVNGEAKFKCSFKGDTLILTGISVFSEDNIANPAYANGLHFVSKLVRVKGK
jgi:hypothetical protein